MIRARMLALLLAVVCGPAAAQEPRPFPQPAAEPTVVFETRWVTAPAGFCDRHLPGDRTPVLGDNELQAFLRAVQADRAAAVLAAPRLTVASGQEGTLQIGETRLFVTGLKTHVVNGTGVLVPQNEPCELGPVVHLRPTVLADGKGVKLDVRARRSVVEKVEMIPFVTQIQPVAEPGTTRPPVPFTQYLQAPTVSVREVSKKLTVPVGGTAVVRGWQEPAPEREPERMTSQIPYLNRMFKSVSNKPATVEVVLLVTARTAAAEPAPNPIQVVKAEEEITAPESGPQRVTVHACVLDAPPGFAADLGFDARDPGATRLVLTGREHQLCTALIRAYKSQGKIDFLSSPCIQVPDRQTGYVRVGADGGPGVEARVTPAVAADGNSVVLRVRFKQTTETGPVDLGNGKTAPGFNTQEIEVTATAPFGGTVVLRQAKNRSAAGKPTETFIFLTAHKGELPK